jgi:uncharacterized protein GlcG (DUF336 family)
LFVLLFASVALTQYPDFPYPGYPEFPFPFPEFPYPDYPYPEYPAESAPEPVVSEPVHAEPVAEEAQTESPAVPEAAEPEFAPTTEAVQEGSARAAEELPRTLITGPILTADDVRRIVEAAAKSASNNSMVIAVTDRQGDILAVFRKPDAPAKAIANFSQEVDVNELAVALARTAAFFSNGQAPLSSRTVRFISGIHFPPGISFTGNAALYGIENTNRGCIIGADYAPGLAVPPARSIDGTRTGLGIITGKKDLFDSDPDAVNPGGVPLYKEGELVGGIGVAGVPPQVAEYAAFIGAVSTGFGPTSIAAPGVVFIDGIALPFVDQQTAPDGIAMGTAEGTYVVEPRTAPGSAPEGDLVIPRAGPVGGLTQAEVRQIIDRAIAASNQTRAVIRLPLGSKARMVIAIADLDGKILALHRMKDTTFFSVDVALAKARNVIYFSSEGRAVNDLPGVPRGTAVTNRTISYGAQPFFPPGLDYTKPGPFFELYKFDTQNPCTQGAQPPSGAVEALPGLSKFRAAAEESMDAAESATKTAVAADAERAADLPPNPQNGIVFFPGALPLYKNGVLAGGLGVSGDGVEQDDYVSAQAALGFEPPPEKRADRVFIDGVRLPYLKFPRNPTQ